MCIAYNVTVTKPLTWREECLYGRCKNCVNPKINVPQNIRKIKVTYSSWQNGKRIQEKRKRKTRTKLLKKARKN